MCVAERKDYARKCSEAGRLKDLLQRKCSPSQCKSDTRGLYASLPHFVSVRLKDFLSMLSPEQYQSQVNQPECAACGTQTRPLDCCFL